MIARFGDDFKRSRKNAENLAADTNGDGKVTPADSTVILRAYVGLKNIEI